MSQKTYMPLQQLFPHNMQQPLSLLKILDLQSPPSVYFSLQITLLTTVMILGEGARGGRLKCKNALDPVG